MQLQDVLDSKIYVKESGAVKFEAPKYYLEPIIASLFFFLVARDGK